MPTITPTTIIRVRHPVYGPGSFHRLLSPYGHVRIDFDGTDKWAPGQRRVLTKDLRPERAELRLIEDREVVS